VRPCPDVRVAPVDIWGKMRCGPYWLQKAVKATRATGCEAAIDGRLSAPSSKVAGYGGVKEGGGEEIVPGGEEWLSMAFQNRAVPELQ
jgi:hypothetical protein